MRVDFEHTYHALGERFSARVAPTAVVRPTLLAFNDELAALLGLDRAEWTSPEGLEMLGGNSVPEGALPIALAYAGHQFGGFVPRLGDGRAILLGEVAVSDGRRFDVQLKGSGPTPFSRNGDGRAALGPVLREFLLSEAMAALGVPTTRALAAVATGERVYRQTAQPGAVLTRVASSHLRVGTFEYFAARRDHDAIATLVAYAMGRHYPEADTGGANAALVLLDHVVTVQARLVARWMALGFVHGVLNTDNCAISGETLDYGPCAFLDVYDPARTFSSIDQHGRYAYGNQPQIVLWNLSRLAETLLPIIDESPERAAALATEVLERYAERFEHNYLLEMRRKLGLSTAQPRDAELVGELLEVMAAAKVDFTSTFRALSLAVEHDDVTVVSAMFGQSPGFVDWAASWRRRAALEGTSAASRAALMRGVSPAFIPRNHRVEEMIAAALAGDLAPFERLRKVLSRPYDDQPAAADLARPPGDEQWGYVTFCGT